MKRESKYNLSDDDEDEINIHNVLLSENDDFDEEVPLDDGSDEEGTPISGWNTILSSCYSLSI